MHGQLRGMQHYSSTGPQSQASRRGPAEPESWAGGTRGGAGAWDKGETTSLTMLFIRTMCPTSKSCPKLIIEPNQLTIPRLEGPIIEPNQFLTHEPNRPSPRLFIPAAAILTAPPPDVLLSHPLAVFCLLPPILHRFLPYCLHQQCQSHLNLTLTLIAVQTPKTSSKERAPINTVS